MTISELILEVEATIEELRGMNDPLVPCGFCVNGYIAAFAHIDNGICYNCDGTGMERNSVLPADMTRCAGCSRALASGLMWTADEDSAVCPDCYKHVTGENRWYEVPDMCGQNTLVPEESCGDCRDIAGKQGEDW